MLVVAPILPAFILFLPVQAEARIGPFSQLGTGTGIVFPEAVYQLHLFGDFSLTDSISLRTVFEISSLSGVFILPVDEMAIFRFGQEPKIYLGVGIGLLMLRSGLGTVVNLSYSLAGGIEFTPWSLPLFAQLKIRRAGERVTFQLDTGVIVKLKG